MPPERSRKGLPPRGHVFFTLDRPALLDRGGLKRHREPGPIMCAPLADGLLGPAPICLTMADGDYEVIMAVTRRQAIRAASTPLLVGNLVMAGPFEHIS